MTAPKTDVSSLAAKLSGLSRSLSTNVDQPPVWQQVETTARSLADALRVKDGAVDIHNELGQRLGLPRTLSGLLEKAHTNGLPTGPPAPAVYELLRVAANLCMDHDENRRAVLEIKMPLNVLSVLKEYARQMPAPDLREPAPLSLADLKIIKTAVGFLLNVCLGFEPAKTALNQIDACSIILRLLCGVYPAGSWAAPSRFAVNGFSTTDVRTEWSWRSGMANWAWRLISELRDLDEDQTLPLKPDCFPLLMTQLQAFVPPFSPVPPILTESPSIVPSLVAADIEVLEEVSSLLESIALDVEEARTLIAESVSIVPETSVSYMKQLLRFAEFGDIPSYWKDSLGKKAENIMATCKGAVIRAIVTAAGEEKSLKSLWDVGTPGGWYVAQMVTWVRTYQPRGAHEREDLIVCSTLCLGNLARTEGNCVALVQQLNIVPDLLPLLEPSIDIKIKHGAIGLLKHLAQTVPNRATLGKMGLLEKLFMSNIWDSQYDMAETVQVSAIGIAKHMCISNLDNALTVILYPEGDSRGINQILELAVRSDTIAVKSEATRVLVNAIKTLWTVTAETTTQSQQRKKAMDLEATSKTHVQLIVQLVCRSKKFPLLLNDGVVALTMLAAHPQGGAQVLDALSVKLPPPQPASGTASQPSSPVTGPLRGLDVLLIILGNNENPPQLRANVCSLIAAIGRGLADDHWLASLRDWKDSARDILRETTELPDTQAPHTVKVAAAKAVEILSK